MCISCILSNYIIFHNIYYHSLSRHFRTPKATQKQRTLVNTTFFGNLHALSCIQSPFLTRVPRPPPPKKKSLAHTLTAISTRPTPFQRRLTDDDMCVNDHDESENRDAHLQKLQPQTFPHAFTDTQTQTPPKITPILEKLLTATEQFIKF